MRNDPYYWTQDNGAGAPVHFAVTYRQIDMLHHILSYRLGQELPSVNIPTSYLKLQA